MSDTRLIAFMGGGDWADASVDHLVVPRTLDIAAERRAWWDWYSDVYCLALRSGSPVKFMSRVGWLISRGARVATSEEIDVVWDEDA